MYSKELQNEELPEASGFESFELQSNQTLTYIICDTESFQSMLELYEDIQTNDLITFLTEKEEFIEKEVLTSASLTPTKKKSQKHKLPIPDSSNDIAVENSFITEEVIPEINSEESELESIKEKTEEIKEITEIKSEKKVNKNSNRGISKNAASQKKFKNV